jgi:hypothetical protein
VEVPRVPLAVEFSAPTAPRLSGPSHKSPATPLGSSTGRVGSAKSDPRPTLLAHPLPSGDGMSEMCVIYTIAMQLCS